MPSGQLFSLARALVALRVSIAGLFMAHAGVRVANGSIAQFGDFLAARGLVPGVPIVWAITAFELLGGALLALGYFAQWLAGGFVFIAAMGIVLIHARLGWFVGEHGVGGVEYSALLIIASLVVAAADHEARRGGDRVRPRPGTP